MITWITDQVAIGEYSDATDGELLLQEKIDCVLNLRALNEGSKQITSFIVAHHLGIKYFHVSVGCGRIEELKIELRTAVHMLEFLVERYKRILVHCTAGIDRSPYVVAYWMARKSYKVTMEWVNLDDFKNIWMPKAYQRIKEKRPQICEHYEWL